MEHSSWIHVAFTFDKIGYVCKLGGICSILVIWKGILGLLGLYTHCISRKIERIARDGLLCELDETCLLVKTN